MNYTQGDLEEMSFPEAGGRRGFEGQKVDDHSPKLERFKIQYYELCRKM